MYFSTLNTGLAELRQPTSLLPASEELDPWFYIPGYVDFVI